MSFLPSTAQRKITMNKITKEQYEFALARIEELLPLVKDDTPANDRNAVELTVMSDIVIGYEKEHFPYCQDFCGLVD